MANMYFQGETLRQKAEITDIGKVLVDPDTIVISIIDLQGIKKVEEEAMERDATGKYHYDYLIPADALIGLWTAEIKAVKGFTAIEQDQFTVLDSSI